MFIVAFRLLWERVPKKLYADTQKRGAARVPWLQAADLDDG